MMGRPRNDATNDDDPLSINSADGPPIAYSPTIAIPQDDPLLERLARFHGDDALRKHDDLTGALAAAAKAAAR